ncbi:MAG: peptidylprolyl isomerase FKBP-type [Bacteroidetes bacterium]|nr:peptidylprolyl isomerase FKBP-type [Bacteroidota bacterium]
MKTNFTKNILILLGISVFSFLFTSCEKEDKYIDWKVLNERWLEQHKNDPGFKVTESGLCYKVIRLGNPNDRKATSTSFINVNYEGKLINDSIFDESEQYQNYLSNMISGWQEGVIKMHTGDIYQFYIPWELGYGKDGSGSIPPYSTLIFQVELVNSMD